MAKLYSGNSFSGPAKATAAMTRTNTPASKRALEKRQGVMVTVTVQFRAVSGGGIHAWLIGWECKARLGDDGITPIRRQSLNE